MIFIHAGAAFLTAGRCLIIFYEKIVVENVLVNFKDENVKKEKIPDTIKRESSIYILLLSLFELSDKIFGATYIAFMRLKGLSLIQISNLFSIEQILIAFFDYPTGITSYFYSQSYFLRWELH